jgi:ABC-type molybdate transport system substrate-binding protein
MCRRFVAVLSVLFLSSAATGHCADHEPMLLRASNVSKAAIEPLVPLCARAAGIEVQAEYANNPAVAKDIIDSARFDVVVVKTRMLDDLATRNLVARFSIRPLAALRMGMATREPPPVSAHRYRSRVQRRANERAVHWLYR